MKLPLLVMLGMLLHIAVINAKHCKHAKHCKRAKHAKHAKQEKHILYDDQQDPYFWERSGKLEGDMVLTPEQEENLYIKTELKNGVINATLRWPNKVIPYVISNDFNSAEKSFIDEALKEDYARSCVRVVPRTNQADYVLVTGNATQGCQSNVGRTGGPQQLNLAPKRCLTYHTIVHEFLHAAGFYHMHSATERDDFVTIYLDNVESGKKHNFNKHAANVVSNFGKRYDYGSVMHYSEYAFSKNKKKTIVPKQNVIIGAAPKLSSVDIAKLNKMYNC